MRAGKKTQSWIQLWTRPYTAFVAVFFCALYETGMLTRLILAPSSANQTLYQVMKSASWGLPLFVVNIFLALVTLCLTVAFLSRSVWQSHLSEQALKEDRLHALTLAHERDQAVHQSMVAAELHDSVGHDLTAIIALSEGMDYASGKPEIDEAISMINDLALQGLDDTRTAVTTLQSKARTENNPEQPIGEEHGWDDIKPILDHARAMPESALPWQRETVDHRIPNRPTSLSP